MFERRVPSATSRAALICRAVAPGCSSSQAQYSMHWLTARPGSSPAAPASPIGPSREMRGPDAGAGAGRRAMIFTSSGSLRSSVAHQGAGSVTSASASL